MFDLAGIDKACDPTLLSPLVLAYIGDAVYELIARQYTVNGKNAPVNVINSRTRHLVNAAAQSCSYEKIKDMLTDEEASVYRRGRNAKSHTSAKNQTVADYRRATGIEALFGYLYLKGSSDRICELFEKITQ